MSTSKTPAQLDREIEESLDAQEKAQALERSHPRAVAGDFPEGTRVSFVHRGHVIRGVSRGSDHRSELRIVVEDEDRLRWIVEAHKVKKL